MWLGPLGQASRATPPNPMPSPIKAVRLSRCPQATRSNRAIQSGTAAMISDATPVSTRFSAHATPALPTRNSNPPTMPAATHCFRPGRSPSVSPRLTDHA
jgi:hypothetical protein